VSRGRGIPDRAAVGQFSPNVGLSRHRGDTMNRWSGSPDTPSESRLARILNSTAIGPLCLVRSTSLVFTSSTSGACGHRHDVRDGCTGGNFIAQLPLLGRLAPDGIVATTVKSQDVA
jgi:hypothetical protein